MIFEDLKNEIVENAIRGHHDAQLKLLKRYEGYINKLSTVTEFDKFGNTRKYVSRQKYAKPRICRFCLKQR